MLLYWANFQIEDKAKRFTDGFRNGASKDGFRRPFSPDGCNMYNLHGGLHLFEYDNGRIKKALRRDLSLLDVIKREVEGNKRLPIYVAEGNSDQKLRKIRSVPYLDHCYQKLKECSGTIFIYGQSAGETDDHIYEAIFKSKIKHIYFGVYKLDAVELRELDGRLAKHQKTAGSDTPYNFFDSETANVWPQGGDVFAPAATSAAT